MIAACVALVVAAPPPLRLADLLREAREKNPELNAARARARAEKDTASAAGALEDPTLSVQLWNAPVDFSTIPVMVQLAQPLPLGGKRGAREDMAGANAAAAAAELAARERESDSQVAAAYIDLFVAERTDEVDDELEKALKVLLQLLETRVGTARSEQVDLLRAQAALVQVRSDRAAAMEQRQSAWARLNALVDRDASVLGPATSAPGLLPSLPELGSLQARALRNRPELAAARAHVAAAEAQARLAKAARVPDLSVFVAEMHTFRNPVGVSDFLFAGVQVNLPIFAGKNGPLISSAEAQLVAARESEHALRNRVRAEVAEAHAHLSGEQRQIDLHHQLIPISRQAVDTAQASYAAGRGDSMAVIESARELRMHDLELASHLAMYERRLAELQAATGSDLGLDDPENVHDERH